MELWDLYDKDGKPTGETHIRGEAIPEGRYHIVCEVLLRHRDGDYLLMQRCADKYPNPGAWEATAGGSALSGEDALQCIRRELREETGLEGEDFRRVAYHVFDDRHSQISSFVAVTDDEKQSVRMQEGETQACRWVSEEEFIRFLRSGEGIVWQKMRYESYFRSLGYLE